jgi:hypothetical protein
MLLCLVLLASIEGHARAHEGSAAYARLRLVDDAVSGDLDLAYRDVERLLPPPDATPPPEGTWKDALARRIREGLRFRSGERECPVSISEIADHEQEGLVRAHVVADCGAAIRRLSVRYTLLDADPTHRAFVSVEDAGTTHSAVLGGGMPSIVFEHATAFAHFVPYLREGTHHVATGFDHLLFLAALLLPAAMTWSRERWLPREKVRDIVVEIALVATAFTVAHSLTLCVGALDLWRPPRRWVESAIAFTVLVAALNNVGHFLRGRAWKIALCLGLVHGFGFAAQLGILGLPLRARLVALCAFNLGIECGQLVVIAVSLPLLVVLRRYKFYPLGVVQIPSLVIAWIAGVWLFERASGVTLLG